MKILILSIATMASLATVTLTAPAASATGGHDHSSHSNTDTSHSTAPTATSSTHSGHADHTQKLCENGVDIHKSTTWLPDILLKQGLEKHFKDDHGIDARNMSVDVNKFLHGDMGMLNMVNHIKMHVCADKPTTTTTVAVKEVPVEKVVTKEIVKVVQQPTAVNALPVTGGLDSFASFAGLGTAAFTGMHFLRSRRLLKS